MDRGWKQHGHLNLLLLSGFKMEEGKEGAQSQELEDRGGVELNFVKQKESEAPTVATE